jgi:ATP-binding cassette subfamily F protein 3
MELQQAAFAKQQDKIAHLQKFIDRFKAKASKAKQAQSRVKALERMEKRRARCWPRPSSPSSSRSRQPAQPDAGDQRCFVWLPDEDGTRRHHHAASVNRSVLAGQRIGILGANGQGKSTLVKTIAREMAPLAGTVTEGKGLNIGYFAQQELDVLRPATTRWST